MPYVAETSPVLSDSSGNVSCLSVQNLRQI